MKKGQITVEYLIIIVIMILLFSSVSMELIDFSLTNTMQIQTNEIIRQTNSSFHNAIDELSLQAAGSKTTVKIRSSTDCDFLVSGNSLTTICDSASSSFTEFEGLAFAIAPAGITYTCLTCNGGLISNGELEIVQISKN